MAQIKTYPGIAHVRGDATAQTIFFRKGRVVRSGRGLAFWFRPLSASLAEVPLDDRELPFLFHGRSSDFQDVTAQGAVTFRVTDPDMLAGRIDFSIDPRSGLYRNAPLEQVAGKLSQLAQQFAWEYLSHTPLAVLVTDGVEEIRSRIADGLAGDTALAQMGIEVVSARVAGIHPTPEVERALQTPTLEAVQQAADEATFERRALAVEKERAIAENELQNQIELAKREESLVAQRGANERRRAAEEAESKRIESEGMAERARVETKARAEGIALVGEAQADAEAKRMAIYSEMPPEALLGLAAKELANKLQSIGNLTITPELVTPILANLLAPHEARES